MLTGVPFAPIALKKKHSKTGEDSKYHGTILGRGNDQGEILIEGAEELTSIDTWVRSIAGSQGEVQPEHSPAEREDRPATSASSVLSSVGDRLDGVEMDTS